MRSVLTIIIILFLNYNSFSQGSNFENISTQDGLGQSNITSIFEAENGLIFFGTNGGGYSTFNGQALKTYNTSHGLENNFIKAIGQIKSGLLLVANEHHIQSLQGQVLKTLPFPSDNPIVTIVQYEEETYLITNKEIYTYKNEQWNLVISVKGQQEIQCLVVSGDYYYVGSNSGLTRFKKNNLSDHQVVLDKFSVNHLILKEDGSLICGTSKSGIQYLAKDQHYTISERNGLSSNQVNDLLAIDDHTTWVSTNNGITIWENKEDINSYKYLNEKNGLSSNQCSQLYKDSWNNIWIGTINGGVSKYAPQEFIHYSKTQGLGGKKIYAIGQDKRSTIWIANDAKGASLLNGNQFKYYNKQNGFVDVKINAIHKDSFQRLWLGTDKGLVLVQDSSFQIYAKSNGLSNEMITDVVSNNNEIWVSTFGGGLNYLISNPNEAGPIIFRNLLIKDGLISNTIIDLAFDSNNKLWYASKNRGIAVLDQNNSSTFFNAQNGLSSDNINCIVVDSLNNVFVGSNGGGLDKLFPKNKKIINYNTTKGLSSNIIKSILIDNKQIWLGNEKGVDQVSWKLNNITKVNSYSQEEGFEGIECLAKASFKDASGAIWFGTVNGLMKYQSGKNSQNSKAPKVFISSVKVNDNFKNIQSNLELTSNENSLDINFSGSDLGTKGRLNYQWALNNGAWSSPSENQQLLLSNLKAGEYTFKLRSINRNGTISNIESLEFSIKEALLEKWWFKLLAALLGLLLIAAFIKWRVSIVKKNIEREKSQLQLEKDLIGLEQKALQLQMNPHFIFNCLNSIQGQIGKVEDRKVKYNLSKFSKLMRSILNHSREENISLAEEIELLNNYLTLEQMSRYQSFDFEINVLDNLDINATFIPPLMIQPFVENAILHGVAQLDIRRGQININFKIKGKYLLCEIKDNGIGRKAAKEIKNQQAVRNKSVALKVNSERLDLLHKDKKLKALVIKDLVDDNDQGIGTLVVMHLPLSISDH